MAKNIKWAANQDPIINTNTDTEDKNLMLVGNVGTFIINSKSMVHKLFNFEIMHTNFDLNAEIVQQICEVRGVETLDIISRYRARVGFGEMFDSEQVKNTISRSIMGYERFLKGNATKLDKEFDYWAICMLPDERQVCFGGGEISEVKEKVEEYKTTNVVNKVYQSWKM